MNPMAYGAVAVVLGALGLFGWSVWVQRGLERDLAQSQAELAQSAVIISNREREIDICNGNVTSANTVIENMTADIQAIVDESDARIAQSNRRLVALSAVVDDRERRITDMLNAPFASAEFACRRTIETMRDLQVLPIPESAAENVTWVRPEFKVQPAVLGWR